MRHSKDRRARALRSRAVAVLLEFAMHCLCARPPLQKLEVRFRRDLACESALRLSSHRRQRVLRITRTISPVRSPLPACSESALEGLREFLAEGVRPPQIRSL